MKFVDYPSSEDEDELNETELSLSATPSSLPQLPPHFHDLYSGKDLLCPTHF